MASGAIVALILSALLTLFFVPLISGFLLHLPAVKLGSGNLLDLLSGCLAWWGGLSWLPHTGVIVAAFALTFLILFAALITGSKPERKRDGGPLGNARVVENKKGVRKASDMWDGKGRPQSCGLVYGFDGSYLYEAATPHTLTVSATGGGKTRFLVLETLHLMAEYGSNLVVSDIKNELLELCGDGLRAMGYNVLLLDLQNPRRGQRYNPLQIVVAYAEAGRIQDAETAAETIAQALVPDEGDGSAHWTGSARGLLSAAILMVALAEDCPHEAKNLYSVGLLINQGTEGEGKDPTEPLKNYVRKLDQSHPARTFASQFMTSQGNELASIISTCKRNLRPYMSRDIAWMTSGNDIDVRQVLTTKTALFLHVMDEGSPYNSLFAVFFDQLYKETDRVCDEMGGKLPIECNIVGDEWGNLPKVNSLASLTSLGRSKGLRWHGIIQNISQLNKYGKDTDRQKILANCGVKVAIRLNELEDQEYFSRQVGKTTRHTESTSTSNTEKRTTTGTSFSEVADFVIHEDEWKLRAASRDGVIVIKSGEEGAPKSHAGVFRVPVADASKTPAKKRFDLGSKEHESKRKLAYQKYLIERAEANRESDLASWIPKWPTDDAEEEVEQDTATGLVDEFSDYAEGL